MITVGLTGSIGTGKTTVAKIFNQLGIPIFYADAESKKILTLREIKEPIANQFGQKVFDNDGNINRSALATVVFSDSEALRFLNALIHPRLKQEFEKWLAQQNVPYAIMEAAILFESGFAEMFGKIIVVTASESICIQRVVERNKVLPEQVLARMRNQFPQEEKIKQADFVIQNNGDQFLIPQVLRIDVELKVLHATAFRL